MDVFECIRSRRTVRNFRPDAVPDEILTRILQAGRWAPSSSNSQPWRFIVIRDRTMLKSLGETATQGPFLGEAPMAIAIVMEGATRPDLDAGRALQQMELVAWSEGLGTCFVGLLDPQQMVRVKDMLGIPEGMELITLLPFGYREEGSRGRGIARKPMSELAYGERFGQPL